MSLKPGSKLGRLEILDFIDAGGMGEVYRARDPQLDREVAVKVLPPEVADDPSRVQRMEREARAVGRLNHPNLLAIHDIGSHEGAPYLVCEFLDGTTLREQLKSKRLSLADTLSYGAQIAAGLAAAHEEGVVHRDLKPENVMVSSHGQVKILDFGLAKFTGRVGADESVSPTLTAMTAPESVLGTAACMAPEQVAGRPVDHHADQFALGIMLYEMLAGRHPFGRETAPEAMTAILKEDPEPLDRSTTSAPPPLHWIVERCLAKEPEQRFASTSDLARDLATLRDRHRELTTPADSSDRPRTPALPFALATLALVAATAAAVWLLAPDRTGRAAHLDFERVTHRRGTVSAARFDPDGESVIYSASWDGEPSRLYLATPGTPDPIVVGPPDSVLLAVSRQRELLLSGDRQTDGPFLRTGTLSRMPVTGAPRALEESISEAAWGPEGEVLAVVRDIDREAVLESPPGRRRYATRGMIWDLRASPDGRRFAFVEVGHRATNFGPIVIMDADGSLRRLGLSGNLQGLAWSPDGREIWFAREASIVAVDLDGNERLVATFPQRVVLHDVAPDGRVLLAVEPSRWEMAGKAPGADSERDLSWLSYSLPFAISPDGSSVLFNECLTADCTVALRGFDGEPPIILGDGFAVAISPDGTQALSILPWQATELVLIPTGPGERRTIDLAGTGIARANFGTWSPDGRRLFLNADTPEGAPHVFQVELETGEVERITPEEVRWGFVAVSPDGERIAVQLARGGTVVLPLDGGEPVPIPGLDEQPVQWSADGRFLFTYKWGQMPLEIRRVELSTGASERFTSLEPTDTAGAVDIGPIAVTSNGDGYVYGYPRRLSELLIVKGME